MKEVVLVLVGGELVLRARSFLAVFVFFVLDCLSYFLRVGRSTTAILPPVST